MSTPRQTEPRVQERAEQPYAAIRREVTMETIPEIADRIPEVFAWLGAHEIAPAGAPFLKYDVIDRMRRLVIEAGVPVAVLPPDAERLDPEPPKAEPGTTQSAAAQPGNTEPAQPVDGGSGDAADGGSGDAANGGRVRFGVLPAGRYVTLTHVGPFDRLVDVTAYLLDWAAEHHLPWDMSRSDDGERWACRLEQYMTNPAEQPDMAKWETVLAFKLA